MDKTWLDLVKEGRYGAINYLELEKPDQAALLTYLKAIVPMVGGRYLKAHEVPPELFHAAQILEEGLLEREVAGDIPNGVDAWQKTVQVVLAEVGPYADDAQPTGVNKPPAYHVASIMEALAQIRIYFAHYVNGVRSSTQRSRIEEAIAMAALSGFNIGQDVQIVRYTPVLRSREGDHRYLIDAKTESQKLEREREAERARADASERERSKVNDIAARKSKAVDDYERDRTRGGLKKNGDARKAKNRAILIHRAKLDGSVAPYRHEDKSRRVGELSDLLVQEGYRRFKDSTLRNWLLEEEKHQSSVA